MAVATQKPEPTAELAVERFGLTRWFETVSGAADDAAAATGQKVTGIRSIVVDPSSGPAPASGGVSKQAASPAADSGSTTPVSAGRQQVDATVEVVYTLAPA